MFIGDLNHDMLAVSDKAIPLQNVCDYSWFSEFSKTIILIVTLVMFTVSVQIRGSIIQRKNELKGYRNVKHFSDKKFLKEIREWILKIYVKTQK